MTTIYLVRHAEAEGNIYKRCQGQFNSNLTPFGLSQLPKLAERFAGIDVDAVYSSDLKRAFLTAKSIADIKGLDVTTSKNLREINMGILEDTCWANLTKKHPELEYAWNKTPENCEIPDGESPTTVANRLFDEICKIASENDGKSIVIASHGAGIRYLLYKIKGLALNDLKAIGWCDNTAVAKLVYKNGKLTDEYINDNSHVEGMKHPFESKKWYEMTEEELAMGVNLWFRPIEIDTEFDILCDYIKEFHQIAYGTSEKFNREEYLGKCKRSLEIDPNCMCFAMLQDNIIGVASADVEISTENIGYIGNIIVNDRFRGLGLTPQLIGELSSIYRKMGKDTLVARVAKENYRAQGFYKKVGFVQGENFEKDGFEHIIMALDLRV
ncbi:MAG: GNAT family N-acetyltransferase [Clostridia bacterium]